ncbi:hypothetical protein [Bacteriovorax sp. Seq25_V]|uniref:hypothetical protein n=1 Tax=Bacteriovorax sp. Seq25_V TaxID=1201288 RepID=UPI00038A31DB|nr:hypothetical protein [Bacteriovorax sp. Seq25_V]EQC43838.1 hypothetical protein M900_1410 [Bacteriovorax sp. Seq25_V]
MFKIFILLFSVHFFASAEFHDSAQIPEIAQREYIYTDSTRHQYVQTYGVYTCLAVVFYSESTQTGVLAHIDSATKLPEAVSEIAKLFKGDSYSVRIYGGQAPYYLESRVVETLENFGIEVSDIVRNTSRQAINIVLELKTGEVFEYDEMHSSTNYKIRQAKVDRLKFSKRLYRHQDSSIGGDIVMIDNSTSAFDLSGFLLP